MGNATLELFNMLTKLLDTFADVGTEKIIEAMMRSSASMNSSSNEMMETRKQILTRVLLKSLQTGDTVRSGQSPWVAVGRKAGSSLMHP